LSDHCTSQVKQGGHATVVVHVGEVDTAAVVAQVARAVMTSCVVEFLAASAIAPSAIR
jgi:hypothetical protein